MNLPRLVVRLTERNVARWTVEVTDWPSGEAVFQPFELETAEVAVGGVDLRVPVVPPGRRPAAGAPHFALCTGKADAVAALLERLAARNTQPGDVTAYGRWLFECLLAPAWAMIRVLPAVIAARGVELALEWPVDASDLHRLVWEAMHDGSGPLAGHPDLLVAVTRLVPVISESPATITQVPRVLFAVGSPLTDEVIRPGAMFMGLLRAFEAEGICTARVASEVTVTELAEECGRFRPDVVHLVAHGDIDGILRLGEHKQDGGAADAGAVATALTTGGRPVVVVLSACLTGIADGPAGGAPMAAKLIAQGIPIVSAMAGEVSEQACRLYTRRLVESLYKGTPVVAATAMGRRAALLRTERPSEQLDWAMPALFLASSLSPAFRPIDPAPTRALIEIADGLQLRQQPVFIGRREILDLLDDFFTDNPARRLGFVGAVREGPLDDLGGTRLLREIGFRLLRAGHTPLLLGPYGVGRAPKDLRGVLVNVLDRATKVTELLRIPPIPLTSLRADPEFAQADRVSAENLARLDVGEAHIRTVETLRAFARSGGVLDPESVRHRLGRDLTRLAENVGAQGSPFGPHTRVVLLGDEVHAWVGALGPLLEMVGKNGLGTAERPAPVLVTASMVQGVGGEIRAFRDRLAGIPGYAFPELTTLGPLEATLGFEWVLLNPWRRDADELYRKVYVAARTTSPADVHNYLEAVGGQPTAVRDRLYLVADVLSRAKFFIADDDDRAYTEYVKGHG